MAEVEDTLAGLGNFKVFFLPVGEHIGSFVHNGDVIDYVPLPLNTLYRRPLQPPSQIRQQLMPQARPPQRKHPPLIILFFRKFQYKLRIFGPLIPNINIHGPTRKQYSVDLFKERLQLGLGVRVE